MASLNQERPTPKEFFNAIESYFKIKFKYDMAANSKNTKCRNYFTEKQNSLEMDWPRDGWCWLNPPFWNLTAWMKNIKKQSARGCRIIGIWPLSGDQNQVNTWIDADVYIIHRRVWPHVRGIMLCKWGKGEFRTIAGLAWDGEKLTDKWGVRVKRAGRSGRPPMLKRIARQAAKAGVWALAWAWAWTRGDRLA